MTNLIEHSPAQPSFARLDRIKYIVKTDYGHCMPVMMTKNNGECICAAFMSGDGWILDDARYLPDIDILIEPNRGTQFKVCRPEMQPDSVLQVIKDRKREQYRRPVLTLIDRSTNIVDNSTTFAPEDSAACVETSVELDSPFLPHITEVVASVARTARSEGMIAAGWVFMPYGNHQG